MLLAMTHSILRATAFASAVIFLTLTACAPHLPQQPSGPGHLAGEEELKLQIFLDSESFGPGVVDGRRGEFTRKALALYQLAHDHPVEWLPDTSAIQPFSTYTIAASDFSALGTNSSGPEAQSKQSKMPNTSLIELLSERFHTTQKFLRGLNPDVHFGSVAAGQTIRVPAVSRPFRFDSFPSSYPAPSAATARRRHVIVDVGAKILQVRDGSRTIAAFPITPGSSAHPAPLGEWRVVGSVPWPWYRHDEGVLKRGERTETFYNLPPGPNNPVGIVWAGLNRPGIGIHGTPVPDTIGRAGSHGCIRLSNWDAATFHTMIGKGTTVTIR